METASAGPLKLTITPDIKPAAATAAPQSAFFGEDGLTFKDVLDVINPLQQIPVVSAAYREVSGDTISSASRLAGGALIGGPIGFLVALFNEVLQGETGKDIGGNVLAMINGEGSETRLAQNGEGHDNAPSPTNRSAYLAYQQMQNMIG